MKKSNTTKPKFMPPIKTAVSFLQTISEIPLQSSIKTPVMEKKILQEIEKRSSTLIRHSLQDRENLRSSMTIRHKPGRHTRDISYLHDLRHCKTDSDLQPDLPSILPTEIERLKIYLSAVEGVKTKSHKGHFCFRNSCIGHLNENASHSNLFKSFDVPKTNSLGAPTGQYELGSLKEWFKFMKENYLERSIEDFQFSKMKAKGVREDRLEEFEIILMAGLKEFSRQLLVLNADRGEMLLDIIHYMTLYWSAKLELSEMKAKNRKKEDKEKIIKLECEINESLINSKEREVLLNNEISLLKTEQLVKCMEIQNLEGAIKKLKAERIYRSKIELHRYNKMIKQFNEFREASLTNPQDHHDIKIAKALQKKKEHLTSLILSKIQLLHSSSANIESRLTPEQLIQLTTLSVNTDEIFIEKDSQTDHSDFCVTRTTQCEQETSSIGVDTEEVLDYVVENGLELELKRIKDGRVYNIYITNEHNQQCLALSKYIVDFSDNSGCSSLNVSEDEISETSRIEIEEVSKNSLKPLFRVRFNNDAETQTEEQIFKEIIKADENEFLDWIIKDRKDHLRNIQRQILNTKTELNKVSKFMNTQMHQVNKSVDFDDGSNLSMNTDESFDLSLDADLESLRDSGVISQGTDLASWREGYNFFLGSNNRRSRSRKNTEILQFEPEKTEPKSSKISQKKSSISEEKKKRNTKFKEFRFQSKEFRRSAQKHFTKPKFLENFLLDQKVSQSKRALMSKKMVVKTISNAYSSAISKDTVYFEPLHLFVYEDFCNKYGQIIVVNKKINDLMGSALFYKDERQITTFAKMFGISAKIGIPPYKRPREIFNFFVRINRLLEHSNVGINVGDIKGKLFIPLNRATEAAKEILLKSFENGKVNGVLNIVERKSILDPSKINKKVIEKETFLEVLLDVYDEYNKATELFMRELLEPFRFSSSPKKIHKSDLFMILRFFYPDRFLSLLGTNPLEGFEQITLHSREKMLISENKIINFCFENRFLFAEDLKEKIKEIFSDSEEWRKVNAFPQEVLKYKMNFDTIYQNKDKLGLDIELLNNWESKIFKVLESPEVHDKMIVLWKILSSEVKRVLSEC